MAIVNNKSMLLVFRGNSKAKSVSYIFLLWQSISLVSLCAEYLCCVAEHLFRCFIWCLAEKVCNNCIPYYSFRSKQESPSWLLQCTNIHCIIGVISFSLSLRKFRSLICAHFISFSLIISLFKKAENNIQAQLASSYHIVVLNKQ